MYLCEEFYTEMPSLIVKVIYGLLNLIIVIAAIIPNSVTIFLIVSKQKLRNASNYFLFALALADIGTVFLGGTLNCVTVLRGPTSSSVQKIVATMVSSTFVCTTILLLTLIIRDRYRTLLFCKTRQLQHTSTTKAITLSAISFFMGFSFSLSFLFELQGYQKGPFHDGYNGLRGIEFLSALFMVGFAGIVWYSVKIRRILKNHESRKQPTRRIQNAAEISPQTKRSDARYYRITANASKRILILLALYIAAYLPLCVIFILEITFCRSDKQLKRQYAYAFVWCTCISNVKGILNPFIYSFRCQGVRKELHRISKQMRRRIFRQSLVQVQPNKHDNRTRLGVVFHEMPSEKHEELPQKDISNSVQERTPVPMSIR